MFMKKFGKVCKEYMIKEIAQHLQDYPDFFVTSFSRISVGDIEKLKKDLKKTSAIYITVKNSMLKRALETSGIDIGDIWTLVTDSCGILFSKNDAVATARSLVNFTKEHESLKIRGGFINGEKISLDTVKLLAFLPPRDVLLATVASGMKAPISGFVGLLGGLLRNLVGVIDAVSKKKSEV
jgi:large subunit ribosomal protein L10